MKHGPLKKIYLPPGEESLEVTCLRNGTLDVRLTTGEVLGFVRGKWIVKRLKKDDDGYLMFFLNRERKQRRGKPIRERRPNGKERLRYRDRRCVLVHRLVKIKALAVAKGGRRWREYVADLPRGIDVNHDGPKDDNRAWRLTMETERANRSNTEMTDEEWDQLQAVF
jgi:hypothetical protein